MTRKQKLKLARLEETQQKRIYEKSYYQFFKGAWNILEPANPFVKNWHYKYVCDVLQEEIHRIGRGDPKTTDWIFNFPPRSGKSMMVSIMLCPWTWIHYPWMRFINSSYDTDLSIDHLVNSRDVIKSDWYQERWGHIYQMTGDQNAKKFFRNNHRGQRIAASVGGGVAGKGADIIIPDDLINPLAADSEADRLKANRHYDQELYNRLNRPKIGIRILTAQRLNEDDTAGHALEKDPKGYTRISIPAEVSADPEPSDLARLYKAGLFFPDRFDHKILEAAKLVLGPMGYASQYNQSIMQGTGNLYSREWFNTYGKPPEEFDVVRSYWDLSFKKGPKNSYVVGLVFGRREEQNYLLYIFREKCGINESEAAIARVCLMFPYATEVVIEDKANGPAVMEQLGTVIAGLRGWPEEGVKMDSKPARWMAASPIARARKVWLPDPNQNEWAGVKDEKGVTVIETFIKEIITAPNSKYLDQMDCFAMAMLDLNNDSLEKLRNFVNFLSK